MKVINGDCLIEMKKMEDNSIDFIITDPPYGLKFMNKSWDHGIPSVEYWKEAYRICKPGAMIAAFGGTRTQHRLTCAIEDSGWEIRDVIMWLYGSGFPKSHNISKAIDKRGGDTLWWFADWLKEERIKKGLAQSDISKHFLSKSGGITGRIHNWEKGTNVPTPEQFNKLCDILNLPFKNINEAQREFVSKGKSGRTAIWQKEGMGNFDITKASSELANKFDSYGTTLKPAYEPIILAMKPLEGTFAQNAEKWGIGGINIDAGRIEAIDQDKLTKNWNRETITDMRNGNYGNGVPSGIKLSTKAPKGRWPANIILDEETAEMLDNQSGISKSSNYENHSQKQYGDVYQWSAGKSKYIRSSGHNDHGGASRFFYCAKASSSERGKENIHPTVKPLSLMRYLIKLLAPPGNPTLLDPFAGSGSTLVASAELGINAIGIEKETEYCEIANKRIDFALVQAKEKSLIPEQLEFRYASG